MGLGGALDGIAGWFVRRISYEDEGPRKQRPRRRFVPVGCAQTLAAHRGTGDALEVTRRKDETHGIEARKVDPVARRGDDMLTERVSAEAVVAFGRGDRPDAASTYPCGHANGEAHRRSDQRRDDNPEHWHPSTRWDEAADFGTERTERLLLIEHANGGPARETEGRQIVAQFPIHEPCIPKRPQDRSEPLATAVEAGARLMFLPDVTASRSARREHPGMVGAWMPATIT